MSQIPIIVYLVPVFGLVLVGYMYMMRGKRLAAYDTQYANYRVGPMSQRLGLTLVEGDPQFNLWITQANEDVSRGPSDARPLHVQVRMTGNHGGIPLEFVYLHRVEQETGFSEVRRKIWFDCRLIAHARQPFPPFEVTSKQGPVGTIAQIQPLPPALTGNPAVDATYTVATNEPRMAQVLGSVLPGFSAMVNSGIHIVGDGKTVAFVMKEDKPPLIPSALYYAEIMAEQLVHVARTVGG
jgi:hypothetical protein